MPTFPDKEAAKHISRPARKQPSPDPRLQPSASAIANRAAEVGTLFSKPGEQHLVRGQSMRGWSQPTAGPSLPEALSLCWPIMQPNTGSEHLLFQAQDSGGQVLD